MKIYKKKKYNITAEKVEIGTNLYNFLEDCKYVTDTTKSIKLTGTIGENWPITIDKLMKAYTFIDGTPITPEKIPEGEFEIATIVGEDAEIVFAEQITSKKKVVTSCGEILTANRDGIPHGNGDFIVYANNHGIPNDKDKWVVNGMVFLNTYEEA